MTDSKQPKTNEGTNKETVYSPKPAGTVEKVNPTSGDTHAEIVKPAR